ncbi:FixH family protein [Novosphingobium bradum]|uniref:FixH family protein n=1 Tax=Novosphingobium bradum TaxID=1737444 RepID=A0ABV7IVW2_9SPHN
MSSGNPGKPVRPFTGRHMALIMVAFFGVVIAVNVTMARLATSTFTGVVVENSYVASQHFNRWLDEARREDALGWRAQAVRDGDGHVRVTLAGAPAGAAVRGDAWHPLGRAPDHELRFVPDGAGFRSVEPLAPGRWRIRLDVSAGGQRWRTEDMVG